MGRMFTPGVVDCKLDFWPIVVLLSNSLVGAALLLVSMRLIGSTQGSYWQVAGLIFWRRRGIPARAWSLFTAAIPYIRLVQSYLVFTPRSSFFDTALAIIHEIIVVGRSLV